TRIKLFFVSRMKPILRMKWQLLPFAVCLFLSILVLTPHLLLAQNQQTIKGTITDGRTNSPMPDVNVVVKGTGNGTKTGANGEYTIKAKSGDLLTFPFSGYETHDVKVQGTAPINYTLKESTSKLDEV